MEQILLGVLGKLVEQGGPWLLIVLLIGVIVYQQKTITALQAKIVSILESTASSQTSIIANNTAALQASAASQAAATEASRQNTSSIAVLTEVVRRAP